MKFWSFCSLWEKRPQHVGDEAKLLIALVEVGLNLWIQRIALDFRKVEGDHMLGLRHGWNDESGVQ